MTEPDSTPIFSSASKKNYNNIHTPKNNVSFKHCFGGDFFYLAVIVWIGRTVGSLFMTSVLQL